MLYRLNDDGEFQLERHRQGQTFETPFPDRNDEKERDLEKKFGQDNLEEYIYVFSMTGDKCFSFPSVRSMESEYSVTYFADINSISAKEVDDKFFIKTLGDKVKNSSKKIYFVSNKDFSDLLFSIVSKKDSKVITLKIPKTIGKYQDRTLSFEKVNNIKDSDMLRKNQDKSYMNIEKNTNYDDYKIYSDKNSINEDENRIYEDSDLSIDKYFAAPYDLYSPSGNVIIKKGEVIHEDDWNEYVKRYNNIKDEVIGDDGSNFGNKKV